MGSSVAHFSHWERSCCILEIAFQYKSTFNWSWHKTNGQWQIKTLIHCLSLPVGPQRPAASTVQANCPLPAQTHTWKRKPTCRRRNEKGWETQPPAQKQPRPRGSHHRCPPQNQGKQHSNRIRFPRFYKLTYKCHLQNQIAFLLVPKSKVSLRKDWCNLD